MKVREDIVFKWLVIIVAAVALMVVVTLVTRPLVGAILLALLLAVAVAYAYRWSVRKWRESRH